MICIDANKFSFYSICRFFNYKKTEKEKEKEWKKKKEILFCEHVNKTIHSLVSIHVVVYVQTEQNNYNLFLNIYVLKQIMIRKNEKNEGVSKGEHKENYETNEESKGFLSENIELLGKNIKKKDFKVFFPEISLSKIIVWISFIQVLIYILCCLLSENLVAPSVQVLMFFGATYGPSIRHGELWRLVLPIFLHANWWHLIINTLCILNLGLTIENKYRKNRFMFIYFGSGIIGNMLTTICNPCLLAVGASTSGFGLIGCSIIEIFLAWEHLNEKAKRHYSLNISLFLLFFLFVSFSPTVDMFGHLGGFICGAFLSCHFNKFLGYDLFQKALYYGLGYLCALICIYLPIRLFIIGIPCRAID